MKEYHFSWKEFKNYIKDIPLALWRGQSDSNWELLSSFQRSSMSRPSYKYWVDYEIEVKYQLSNELKEISESNQGGEVLKELSILSFLQHYGFPTPLLDWTESPYVAAFFAFDGINTNEIKNERFVSIFLTTWTFLQTHNLLRHGPNLELENIDDLINYTKSIRPPIFFRTPSLKNTRSISQQSWLMITNHANPTENIEYLKNKDYHHKHPDDFCKINIPYSEYFPVIDDLLKMNVNHSTLFHGTDSICKFLRVKLEAIASRL